MEHSDRADNLDVSQRWLRHLRGVAKSTINLPCYLCKDRKIFASDDDLLAHVFEAHSDQIPPKSDGDALAKFKTNFLARARYASLFLLVILLSRHLLKQK